jgi:nucleoside 2-deoxyribosyltransferase
MVANGLPRANDIFLSYIAADSEIAAEVEVRLEQEGISVFNPLTDIEPAEDFYERVREELGACEAVVAIVSIPSAAQRVELGGAWAWKKPVYVITIGHTSGELGGYEKKFETFSLNQLENLASRIKANARPMTDDQRIILADVFQRMETPVDSLPTDPEALAKLERQFEKRAKTRISQERLLRELLVLRKSGRWRPKKTMRARRQVHG